MLESIVLGQFPQILSPFNIQIQVSSCSCQVLLHYSLNISFVPLFCFSSSWFLIMYVGFCLPLLPFNCFLSEPFCFFLYIIFILWATSPPFFNAPYWIFMGVFLPVHLATHFSFLRSFCLFFPFLSWDQSTLLSFLPISALFWFCLWKFWFKVGLWILKCLMIFNSVLGVMLPLSSALASFGGRFLSADDFFML